MPLRFSPVFDTAVVSIYMVVLSTPLKCNCAMTLTTPQALECFRTVLDLDLLNFINKPAHWEVNYDPQDGRISNYMLQPSLMRSINGSHGVAPIRAYGCGQRHR